MPFTLEELLPDDQRLRTVQQHDTLAAALQLMRQHGYDQLPVVDKDGKTSLDRVVTFDSVLQALESFKAAPDLLRVRDAMASALAYQPDADLLETLDDIQRENFALIVDDEGRLTGIVTTADTTVFFREYAEDLMQIEGIEARMKEAIQAIYADNQADLDAAIEAVTDRAADVRRKLPAAIRGYLERAGINPPSDDDTEAVAEAEKRLRLPKPGKEFELLTFDEFSKVLLRPPNAPKLPAATDVTEVRTLLDRVRDSRNDLAHFRGKLQLSERKHIRFAADWLERNLPRPVIPSPPPQPPAQEIPTPPASVPPGVTPPTPAGGLPREREDEAPHGSYAGLAAKLREVPPSTVSVPMTFRDIERVLGKELPRSAYEYRAWWANNPSSPQSAAWLEEGWRASAINMSEQRLIFERTDDREQAYIKFFASLNERLKKESSFPLYNFSPQGANWNSLAKLDWGGPEPAYITASFNRRKQIRIELYIDFGDREKNKRLFDELEQRKEPVEDAIGEPLRWDRMDNKRASQVAVYAKGQILTDYADETLLEWAKKKAMDFYEVFAAEFARLAK